MTATLTSISVYTIVSESAGPEGGFDTPPRGGGADLSGQGTAESLGTPTAGPIEGGGDGSPSTPAGLVSDLGGEDAHGLEFAGPEVQPVAAKVSGTVV